MGYVHLNTFHFLLSFSRVIISTLICAGSLERRKASGERGERGHNCRCEERRETNSGRERRRVSCVGAWGGDSAVEEREGYLEEETR